MEGNIPITITETRLVSVTQKELGHTIMAHVRATTLEDDSVCDWCTDGAGNTYIGFGREWLVSNKPSIAALVDAANVLIHGKILRLPAAEGSEP